MRYINSQHFETKFILDLSGVFYPLSVISQYSIIKLYYGCYDMILMSEKKPNCMHYFSRVVLGETQVNTSTLTDI